MVNDETFFAWLDGELEAAEAARVEAEVAADPRLSTMAAEHRTMQARLKGAFDTIIDAPMPGHLAAAARTPPQAEVIDFAEARKKSDRAWPSPVYPRNPLRPDCRPVDARFPPWYPYRSSRDLLMGESRLHHAR